MIPPVYIISRGRATYGGHLGHYLDRIGVPYSVVIEEDEHEAYASVFGAARLLVIDQRYKAEYELCDERGLREYGPGPGPARNWIWDYSLDRGDDWHWVFDDNIPYLERAYRDGNRVAIGREWFEPFSRVTQRVKNVGICGPIYHMWVIPSTAPLPELSIAHTMSAHLIRTEIPLRWECRYNDDFDLALRMAKSGWLPLRLNQYLIFKVATQTVKGGSTDTIYQNGTAAKTSQLIARHPEYVKATFRYGRPHHIVDWKQVIKDYNLKLVT